MNNGDSPLKIYLQAGKKKFSCVQKTGFFLKNPVFLKNFMPEKFIPIRHCSDPMLSVIPAFCSNAIKSGNALKGLINTARAGGPGIQDKKCNRP